MEHLFSVWPDIARRIELAGHILLLTDFDGTLAPIVDRPEAAVLPDTTRRWLGLLASNPDVDVGIISGRSLGDLRAKVGIERVTYAGNHGLEIVGPTVTFVHPAAEEMRPVLSRLRRELSEAMKRFSGVLVEDKGLTLSIHYRLLDKARISEFGDVFRRVVERAGVSVGIVVTTGKMVYEIRPMVDWSKGNAIEMLLNTSGARNRNNPMTMFLGDDSTDEDGFKAIERIGGISVFVGEDIEGCSAQYFVRSPDEVAMFLGQLCQAI